jgi:hypothetical protein
MTERGFPAKTTAKARVGLDPACLKWRDSCQSTKDGQPSLAAKRASDFLLYLDQAHITLGNECALGQGAILNA